MTQGREAAESEQSCAPSDAQDSITMTTATTSDATDIIDLRDRRARWMLDHGIDQWLPGEYPVEFVEAEARRGEWFVGRDGAELIGAVRVIWRDPGFWGADGETVAGYIHALMVAPEHRGRGLGTAILRFCADHTRAEGVTVQRLDTASNNRALRKYYAAEGFTEVREAPLYAPFRGSTAVVLMEKSLVATEPPTRRG
ncbi:GNAT family N-acetyltransferase [Nocardia callitridis]